MKADLSSLEINSKDLKKLTGSNFAGNSFKITILGTTWRTIVIWVSGLIVGVVLFDNVDNDVGVAVVLSSFILGPFISMIVPTVLSSSNKKRGSLQKLLEETKKFNLVVKAIDVNDQLVLAGNPGMSQSERKKAIDALRLIKEDLVRALKTERIFRENQDIVNLNPEFFTNNLASLSSISVDDKAGEFGKILGEALSIAREVQEEMQKMQQTSN